MNSMSVHMDTLCTYCGEREVTGETTGHCGNAQCEILESEYAQACIEYWREEERGASRALLRQWGRHHRNWDFRLGLPLPGRYELARVSYRPLARAWYTAKALACLNMPGWMHRRLPEIVRESADEIDRMAIFNEQPMGGEHADCHTTWRAVNVGRGVLRGWNARIEFDASC
jgi:hypothetical protein